MTSSNVSNLLVQVGNVNVDLVDAKSELPKSGFGFDKTLQNAIKPSDAPAPADNSNQADVSNKSFSVSKEPKVIKTEEKPDTVNEEVVEKVNEAVDKVKAVIEEELDVTEEDIEKAMETLGLTVIDLLNPQDLAQLVATLTGENDSIALVMSEEFKGILDVVNELTNQLFEETGISFIEVKDIVISYASQEMIDVDVPKEESLTQVNPEEVLEVAEVMPEEPVAVQVETNIVKTEDSSESTDVVSEDTEPSQQITLKENVDAKQSDSEDSSFEQPNAKTQENVVLKQTTKPSEPIIRNDGMIFGEPRIEIQFSPEEQLVSLPTGQTVSSEKIVNQLVEQARILNEAESTTMEMTLNPEGLGRIFMEVTQKGDEITARIFTENDAVKQALESQMANLRVEMTQNSSAKVTSIEVSVGTHEFEKNLEEDARNEQRRDEQANQSERRSNRIDLNSMDDLTGLMSEEDILIAQMMKDNGNTLDFQA